MTRHATHQCRNCGAPLGIPADHDRYFTCRYCGSVLEDVTPPEQRAAGSLQIVVATEPAVDPDALRSYAKPSRTLGCIGVVITVLALIGVAAGVLAAGDGISEVTDGLSSGGGRRIHNYAALDTVPSGGSAPEVVAVARTTDDLQIVYLDLDGSPQVRWSVPRELEDEVFTQFVVADDLVVVSAGRELFALDRATGDQAWASTLSDAVQPNLCRGCVERFGNSIVTLTVDGVLTATSLAGGETQWSERLTETPRQVVRIGEDPAVLDTVDGVTVLRVFSTATGAEIETLPLSCPDLTFGGRNAIGIYEHLHPVGDGTVVYLANPAFGGCAQRWGPGAGGAPMWEVTYGYPDPSGADDESVIVAADTVLVADRTAVDVLDLATGTPRRVAEVPDADLFPIGTTDGVAVLAARSTRGTAAWSIRGIDLASGGERWRFDPEASGTMLAPRTFAAGEGWTAAVTSGGVSVAQYDPERIELDLRTIEPASGTPSPPRTIDLSGRGITDTLTVHGWSGDDLVVAMVGSLIAVDGPTGRITAEVP